MSGCPLFLFFFLTVQCHSGQNKKVFITAATERGSKVEGETEAERAWSEQPSVWWGVICLPSNSMKILKLASSFFFFFFPPPSLLPSLARDLVIEMKCQTEWVIDCQLDKLSKHLLSGFPVHTYYQITSGWRPVIFHTNHPDRTDNWDAGISIRAALCHPGVRL